MKSLQSAAFFFAGFSMLTGCQGCSETGIRPNPVDTAVEVVEFTNDWGQWLAMDVLPDGAPAVAYYDATEGALGFAIAAFDEEGVVSWQREPVDGYPDEDGFDRGDRGKHVSMAVAADGTVWLAYQDVALGTMRYAVRDTAGVWTADLADAGGGSTSDAGYFTSVALNAASEPVIVHYDRNRQNLRVARWNGTSFVGSVLAEGEDLEDESANVGEFAKIVIASNVEYVTYYDRTYGDLRLSWGAPNNHTTEVIDSEGDVGQWSDVLLLSGTLYVAYHDVGNQDLRLAIGEPGAFESEIIDSGDFVGADTALYFGEGGPAMAYFDGRNNDMKLARRESGAWIIETLTGDQSARGFHNEAVTSSLGTFVACYDYTNRNLWFSAL